MSSGLTDAELEFLKKAMLCLKSPPELNVPKLAEALNIKPKSVTNKWCELKKKLGFGANQNVDGATTTPTKHKAGTGATPKSKKAKATPVKKAESSDDDDTKMKPEDMDEEGEA